MHTVVLCATTLLASCSPSVQSGTSRSDVRLDVEPAAVSAGESVTLVLSNGSTGAIGYNLCTSELERRSNGEWQAIPSDRICTMELRSLAPGQQVRYPLELAEGLAPGEYRFVTNIERLETGERGPLQSGTFRVMP